MRRTQSPRSNRLSRNSDRRSTRPGALRDCELFEALESRLLLSTNVLEYSALPTSNSAPSSVVTASDGTIYFTESGANKIGKLTPIGTLVEYTLPTSNAAPDSITVGPDGNIWFTEHNSGKVGVLTPAGQITEITLPTSSAGPRGIATGADGNLWVVESSANKIARVTTAGVVTEFSITTTNSGARSITAGPDGNLWFTETVADKIGEISTSGAVTEFNVTTANASPTGITTGSDGNLWFTENTAGKIGRITTSGVVTEFSAGSGNAPVFIANGSDGALWYTQTGTTAIARMTTAGVVTTALDFQTAVAPDGIAVGPHGTMVFTESTGNKVGLVRGVLDGNQALAESLYYNTLSRPGTLDEYTYWSNTLVNDGAIAVAQGIGNSGEAHDDLISLWYNSYLGRAAGASDLAYWSNWFNNGSTQEEVLSGILSSSEFYARRSIYTAATGTADQVYVSAVYDVLLGRAPSTNELNYWTSAIATSGDVAVTNGVLGSSEYRGDVISTYYYDVLFRAGSASSSEIAYWVNTGLSLGTIRQEFESTNEYFDLASPQTGVVPTGATVDTSDVALPSLTPTGQGAVEGPDGAMWFTLQNAIGRIGLDGSLTTYTLPVVSDTTDITVGPDGNLWFTAQEANEIGRITPLGRITMYPVAIHGSNSTDALTGITAGDDGAVWFTETQANEIGRIDVSTGAITEYTIPSSNSFPEGIVSGADGKLYFTEINTGKIGVITVGGSFTEYSIPSGTGSEPLDVVLGPNVNGEQDVWFTEAGGKYGKITQSGTITEYTPVTGTGLSPNQITLGADGNLYFIERTPRLVGRIDPSTGNLTGTFQIGTSGGLPIAIAAGPHGSIGVVTLLTNNSQFHFITGLLDSNQAFINSLYNGSLDREPTLSEYNYWNGVVLGGGFTTVSTGIESSTEATDVGIESYFQTYLGVAPTSDQITYFQNEETSGTPEEFVIGAILGSAAYYSLTPVISGVGGAASDTTFVDSIYLDLLGRAPGTSEVAYWSSVADASGRTTVANDIIASVEYRAITITEYYSSLLHRGFGPDTNELNYWLGTYDDFKTLRITFATTPEFYLHG